VPRIPPENPNIGCRYLTTRWSCSSNLTRLVQLVRTAVAVPIAGWHHVAVESMREGHCRQHCVRAHGDGREEAGNAV
jgi:hypothetical protein